ncbi:unnamed protein product [Cochlearia groenlandica]
MVSTRESANEGQPSQSESGTRTILVEQEMGDDPQGHAHGVGVGGGPPPFHIEREERRIVDYEESITKGLEWESVLLLARSTTGR